MSSYRGRSAVKPVVSDNKSDPARRIFATFQGAPPFQSDTGSLKSRDSTTGCHPLRIPTNIVKPGYIRLKNQPIIIRYIEGLIYRVILLSNYPPYF